MRITSGSKGAGAPGVLFDRPPSLLRIHAADLNDFAPELDRDHHLLRDDGLPNLDVPPVHEPFLDVPLLFDHGEAHVGFRIQSQRIRTVGDLGCPTASEIETTVVDSLKGVVRDRSAANIDVRIVEALNRAVFGVVYPDDGHTAT